MGPFVTLLTFSVLLSKGLASSFYLPALILIGFPICWKWKIRGFALALSTLCLFFAISYSHIPLEERFWQFGMGMAIALAFAVTALSFEEVEELIRSLQIESSSRLTNLLNLDEKYKISEGKLHEECEALKEQIQIFQSQIKEKDSQIQRQEKLLEVVRNEFSATQSQQESLLNEIFQKRHEAELLNQRIQAYLKQIEQLTARSLSKISPAEMENLIEAIRYKDSLLAQLQQELKKANQDLINIEAEKDRIQLELIKQKDLLEEKENEYQDHSYQLKEGMETLKREKSLLEASLSKLQIKFEEIEAKEIDNQNKILKLTHQNIEVKQNFERKIDELNGSKKALEADWKNLKKQFEDKEVAFNQVQNRLSQAEHELSQLKAENESLTELNEFRNLQEADYEILKKQVLEKTVAIEQLHAQLAQMEQNGVLLQEENQTLMAELKNLQEVDLEMLKKQVLEKTVAIEQQQAQLAQVEQNTVLLQEENQTLMRELKNLQEVDLETLKQQVVEKTATIEQLQTKIYRADQEVAELKSKNCSLLEVEDRRRGQEAELESFKKQALENEETLVSIKAQLCQANEAMSQLSSEREALKKQLSLISTQNPGQLADSQKIVEADRAFRRMKGLYEQLKCQFADKSVVLDETRKQLFHLEEKFMLHQIELQEKEVFGYSVMEKALEKQLRETQEFYAKMHGEAVQETELLYGVIESLLQHKV
nr:hypothetical protein [Parachlamydia sp. AcF125]